jgi:hypothetical protein
MYRRSDEFEGAKRQRVCGQAPVDIYDCQIQPSETTLYFTFTTPQNLVQVQPPVFKPGDSVCRAFLNSLYPDDVDWYDSVKLSNTIPVHVFASGGYTSVLANVNRPGAVMRVIDNQLDDCDMKTLEHALSQHLQTRVLVLCHRRLSLGPEQGNIETENEALRKLVEKYVPNPVLEFLTPGTYDDEGIRPGGNADFNFMLTADPKHADFEQSDKFVAEHQNTYAMVVYHTCPFDALFSLPLVAQVLQPGGKVIQTRDLPMHNVEVLGQASFSNRITQINGRRFGQRNNWRELVKDFQVSPAALVKKSNVGAHHTTPGGPATFFSEP